MSLLDLKNRIVQPEIKKHGLLVGELRYATLDADSGNLDALTSEINDKQTMLDKLMNLEQRLNINIHKAIDSSTVKTLYDDAKRLGLSAEYHEREVDLNAKVIVTDFQQKKRKAKATKGLKDLVKSKGDAPKPKAGASATASGTRVISVRLDNLRKIYGKDKYANVIEWENEPNHVNIGRKNVYQVEIDGKYIPYPAVTSVFANSFTVEDHGREEALSLYEKDMREQLENDSKLVEKLLDLDGMTLGCWCCPEDCHGDIIVNLIEEYKTKSKPKKKVRKKAKVKGAVKKPKAPAEAEEAAPKPPAETEEEAPKPVKVKKRVKRVKKVKETVKAEMKNYVWKTGTYNNLGNESTFIQVPDPLPPSLQQLAKDLPLEFDTIIQYFLNTDEDVHGNLKDRVSSKLAIKESMEALNYYNGKEIPQGMVQIHEMLKTSVVFP
jgi:hypothetical protein